jgi:hypothetical protein
MKKLIIGALVAALILFIYQFISWGLINFHKAEQQYTPNQEKILEFLGENLTEGQYFLPTYSPGATDGEMQAMAEKAMGKPWATINYNESFDMNMGVNMARGFAIDLVSALLLCWILLKFRDLNFSSALLSCISIGLIGYFTITYLNHVWFEGNTIGYLIDAIVGFGLVGAWLGFYLPEK